MSWDMQQAAVVEFRKLTREEVAAVFDIPPVLLGILDRATFSNVEELHLAFYQDTLGPWTTLLEETFYEQLIAPVPEFADDERMVEFDMNEVLKGAIATRYDAINKATGGPWMRVNEARKAENLPKSDQPEAELIRFPLNMSSDPAADAGPRRAPNRQEAPPMPERKGLLAFEFKAEKEGSFRATFSRFNVVDRDGDVTMPDAFEKGQEVRIAQWGHNWGAPAIGKGAIDFDEERAWVDGSSSSTRRSARTPTWRSRTSAPCRSGATASPSRSGRSASSATRRSTSNSSGGSTSSRSRR
jgi:hypothetical protein